VTVTMTMRVPMAYSMAALLLHTPRDDEQ